MSAIDWRAPEPEEVPSSGTGRTMILTLLVVLAGLACASMLAAPPSDTKGTERDDTCFAMPGSDVAPITCSAR